MAMTIFRQTTIMLILIIVGIVCAKTGIISKSSNKELSKFVLQVVNPIMIFMSYQTDYRPELVRNLLLTFICSVGVFVFAIAASFLLIRQKEGREAAIERFSTIYSNCGFMGIPLANALYGSEGVFYLSAFITVFNLFVWTHGVISISGEKDFKKVIKVFYSPTIIAIVLGLITFFLQIKLPSVASQALTHIKEVNTPLAMVVSGVTMTGTNFIELAKKPRVYYTCLLRLIIVPAVTAAILTLLGIDETVKMIVIIAAAAPPAATCTLMCVNYGKNAVYSSEIFSAGTVFSILTMPAIAKATEYLTKIL